MTFIDNLENNIELFIVNSGISPDWAVYIRLFIFIIILIAIASLSFWSTKRIFINLIYKIFRRTKAKWDDLLVEHKVFNNIAHIIPALFVLGLSPVVFADFKNTLPVVIKLTDAYLIIASMTIVFALLKVGELILSTLPSFKDKPLTSYFQLIRIILYIATGILALSVIMGKSPIVFLSAFGAMTAILLLIFKDTILGLVASVQMSANDMIQVGDWVEMPKFNADGSVIAINLNTVKVQNWDRTITTIPTYFFITDSFKNWRGMFQGGGRRIKRSIYINAHSVKLVAPETREHFKKYQLITDYITDRQRAIEQFNKENNIDSSLLINGRRMTNLGVFRNYVEAYLRNHPRINKDMMILVRQMAADSQGIPLEVYCFTNSTAWVQYETIQSDIFDHLYSVISYFDLEIYQQPSGKDISNAINTFPHRLVNVNN